MLGNWIVLGAAAIALQLFIGANDPDFHEPLATVVFGDSDQSMDQHSTITASVPTVLGTGTTIVPQASSPAGLPHATPGGTRVDSNGQTVTSWLVTHTSTLIMPTTPPAASCASWTIKNLSSTIIVGGGTIIICDPTVTSAFPGSESTATVTEYVVTSGPTGTSTVTTTRTVHSISTTTHVATQTCPPSRPETVTVFSTSTVVSTTTITAPKVTTTSVQSSSSTPQAHSIPTDASPPVGSTANDSRSSVRSSPECVPAITLLWKAHDVYKGAPFVLDFDDLHGGILKIQDGGFKTEQVSDSYLLPSQTFEPKLLPIMSVCCGDRW